MYMVSIGSSSILTPRLIVFHSNDADTENIEIHTKKKKKNNINQITCNQLYIWRSRTKACTLQPLFGIVLRYITND